MVDARDLPPPPALIIDLLVRGTKMLIQWNLFPTKRGEHGNLYIEITTYSFAIRATSKIFHASHKSRVSKQRFPHHFFQTKGKGSGRNFEVKIASGVT